MSSSSMQRDSQSQMAGEETMCIEMTDFPKIRKFSSLEHYVRAIKAFVKVKRDDSERRSLQNNDSLAENLRPLLIKLGMLISCTLVEFFIAIKIEENELENILRIIEIVIQLLKMKRDSIVVKKFTMVTKFLRSELVDKGIVVKIGQARPVMAERIVWEFSLVRSSIVDIILEEIAHLEHGDTCPWSSALIESHLAHLIIAHTCPLSLTLIERHLKKIRKDLRLVGCLLIGVHGTWDVEEKKSLMAGPCSEIETIWGDLLPDDAPSVNRKRKYIPEETIEGPDLLSLYNSLMATSPKDSESDISSSSMQIDSQSQLAQEDIYADIYREDVRQLFRLEGRMCNFEMRGFPRVTDYTSLENYVAAAEAFIKVVTDYAERQTSSGYRSLIQRIQQDDTNAERMMNLLIKLGTKVSSALADYCIVSSSNRGELERTIRLIHVVIQHLKVKASSILVNKFERVAEFLWLEFVNEHFSNLVQEGTAMECLKWHFGALDNDNHRTNVIISILFKEISRLEILFSLPGSSDMFFTLIESYLKRETGKSLTLVDFYLGRLGLTYNARASFTILFDQIKMIWQELPLA